jgi:hypothetical protein
MTPSYWSRTSIVVPTTFFLLVLSLTRNLRSLPDWARAGYEVLDDQLGNVTRKFTEAFGCP